MSDASSFTGQDRRRKTSRSVKVAEAVSRTAITLGGLGTILAVATICIFLVSVVVPLFGGSSLDEGRSAQALRGGAPVALGMDEQRLLGWALLADGSAVAFRVDDGTEIERQQPFGDVVPTALDVEASTGGLVAGFADGSVRFGRIVVTADYTSDEELPELGDLAIGEVATWGRGVVQRTPEGQLRYHVLDVELDDPVPFGAPAPVVALDHAGGGEGGTRSTRVLVVLKADDTLSLSRVTSRLNLLTGKVTADVRETGLPYTPRPDGGKPPRLLVSERGDTVYAAWEDGLLMRFEILPDEPPVLAETINLAPGDDVSLTAIDFMFGRSTLIVGDSAGGVRGWFSSRAGPDGPLVLTPGHTFEPRGVPVTALAPSTRNRLFAAGFADGRVRVHLMTTDVVLAEGGLVATDAPAPAGGDPAVTGLAIAPRNDALVAVAGLELKLWELSADHAETSWSSLFRPVWYEGDAEPLHVWQSSSGTDDFEPKLGLFPLVFGTLKATFYSMIFSVPIALLAAIYTSEFLARSIRTRVKEIVEMMATLPSVVLGFLAALWLAPLVERVVPATLAAIVCVPAVLLLGAYLWQLLPQKRALAWSGRTRLVAMGAAVLAGGLLAFVLGPTVERLLFSGDARAWLDGGTGSAFGGWLVLLLPLAALLVAWSSARWLQPVVRRVSRDWERSRVAGFDLGRFVVLLAATLGLAALVAWGLDGIGLDLREGLMVGQTDLSPMNTYVQRNALIVGFALGFAVIPIIYTLADDALSSVPEHLRAASLATGATPWQTAVRVVVPTAMSGLFSAVMIGLGRAVGETMIVLMAAGNTPVLEANLFNGFRTLSATIAVELPEAVQGGTLYRVLFLAALTLFALTFVINALAEVVRQRFRKRAYEL